ncbi:MAG: peptidase S41, partial [Bacteroidaceae bacterium]|nr:peptidase S41 [Bacteroidaceae bacterium]
QDTTDITSYYRMAINQGFVVQFAYEYTDDNRQTLNKFDDEKKLANYLRNQNVVEQFVKFADNLGLKRRNIMVQKSSKLLERVLTGNIIYIMLDDEEYAKFLNQDDATVMKALEVFKKGESKPKSPA